MKFDKILLVMAMIFAVPTLAQTLDKDLRIMIETPISKAQIGQIGEIRGWAIHPTQVVDVVEIYIDGEFYSEVPVGGQRTDVERAYPDVLNSKYSGYAQTVNFKSLLEGYHTLEVRAYTTMGSYNSVTSEFCVERFTGEFISNPNNIDFTTLELIHTAKNAILLQKVTVEGRFYNIELHWSTATQGLVIEQVEYYENIDGDYSKYCTICEPSE